MVPGGVLSYLSPCTSLSTGVSGWSILYYTMGGGGHQHGLTGSVMRTPSCTEMSRVWGVPLTYQCHHVTDHRAHDDHSLMHVHADTPSPVTVSRMRAGDSRNARRSPVPHPFTGGHLPDHRDTLYLFHSGTRTHPLTTPHRATPLPPPRPREERGTVPLPPVIDWGRGPPDVASPGLPDEHARAAVAPPPDVRRWAVTPRH